MAANETLINQAATGLVTGPMPTTTIGDAEAAHAFRLAVIKLAQSQRESDPAREAARKAAEALADLARADDETLLRELLRPDPLVGGVTWSVACYQIGDLTPNALKDFSNPVSAVNTLASCPNRSHVAAELVASTAAGMRWTAMTRTGTLLGFQMPDLSSASHSSREHPGELTTAVQHWSDQIGRWISGGGNEPDLSFAPAPQWVEAEVGAAVEQVASEDLDEVLELFVMALRSCENRDKRQRQANDELLVRLDDIARRMTEFQASVEAEVGRRIHALATYVAEVAGAFAAQQTTTSERLEARLDQITALLPAAAGRRVSPFELATGGPESVESPATTA